MAYQTYCPVCRKIVEGKKAEEQLALIAKELEQFICPNCGTYLGNAKVEED